MIVTIPDNQVVRWLSLYEEFTADVQQVTYFKKLDEKRLVVQKDMIEFLESYMAGEISIVNFKEKFDRETRKKWDTFGLKGMSGGMFLNKLVNLIPNQNALADQLRSALKVPKSIESGQVCMQAFLGFIEEMISSHQVTKQQIQPARTPFFISAWWHIQSTENWPVFYPNIRQILEIEGLYTSSQNPVKDYFAFREIYLSLGTALGLTSWRLEHLLAWYRQRDKNNIESDEETEQLAIEKTIIVSSRIEQQNLKSVKADEAVKYISLAKTSTDLSQQEEDDEQAVSSHTRTQWLLATIGHKLGCQIWIAMNDQNKVWNDERLGDLSLKALPSLGMDSESQQIISLIDVLWLKGTKAVAAAFEVEHTTSIYSGLLRMSDLVVSSPNIKFPLYIVTPKARLDKVRRELSRPTFQALELHKLCGFFSEEKLLEEAESIMRWATDPSAIERLASRVSDVGS